MHGNYLKGSIRNAGMDPDALPEADPSKMDFGTSSDGSNTGSARKVWKDIWGCGQGIGAVKGVVPTADLVARLKAEYATARQALCQG